MQEVADGFRTARRMFKKAVHKAAASEEARRYILHRVGRWSFEWVLANGEAPTAFPTSEKPLPNVEPLNDARTKLAGFFNSLLSN